MKNLCFIEACLEKEWGDRWVISGEFEAVEPNPRSAIDLVYLIDLLCAFPFDEHDHYAVHQVFIDDPGCKLDGLDGLEDGRFL
jgi:hypothetical protein